MINSTTAQFKTDKALICKLVTDTWDICGTGIEKVLLAYS